MAVRMPVLGPVVVGCLVTGTIAVGIAEDNPGLTRGVLVEGNSLVGMKDGFIDTDKTVGAALVGAVDVGALVVGELVTKANEGLSGVKVGDPMVGVSESEITLGEPDNAEGPKDAR